MRKRLAPPHRREQHGNRRPVRAQADAHGQRHRDDEEHADRRFPFIRSFYALYGVPDNVANVHVDAPHNYNLSSRQAMYRFFAKHLLGRKDADTITEPPYTVERPGDLLAFAERLPSNLIKPAELYQELRAGVREQLAAARPTSAGLQPTHRAWIVKALRHICGADWPVPDEIHARQSERCPDLNDGTVCTFERNGRIVQALLTRRSASKTPPKRLLLCIHPKGMAGYRDFSPFDMNPPDTMVYWVEPFGTGEHMRAVPVTQPTAQPGFFATFNRTDAAEMVYDILTVLSETLHSSEKFESVDLVGFGRCGPPTLVARALVPDDVAKAAPLHTTIDFDAFDVDSDEAYVKSLFLPCIRRIGGLEAVAFAAATTPLRIHNAGTSQNALAAAVAGVQPPVTIFSGRITNADLPDLLYERR